MRGEARRWSRASSCRIFSHAWTYLSNGYMRALASSELIWYDMGHAMPTHTTTGRLWYRPWRGWPSPSVSPPATQRLRCHIPSPAWAYLSNGYMRAPASSDLVRYDMGQAIPTHIIGVRCGGSGERRCRTVPACVFIPQGCRKLHQASRPYYR